MADKETEKVQMVRRHNPDGDGYDETGKPIFEYV